MSDERQLAQVPRDEALRLLASVPIGRVVFTAQALPAIRPVNHLVDGNLIVIRTSLLSAISDQVDGTGTVVAYEADQIDAASRLGWSVIVVGRAAPVRDDQRRRHYRQRLRPWVAGDQDEVITISADLVTGYRLARAGSVTPGRQPV